jgi:peptidyl-prolyl cis-trans isomerase A (cyclophilin A)
MSRRWPPLAFSVLATLCAATLAVDCRDRVPPPGEETPSHQPSAGPTASAAGLSSSSAAESSASNAATSSAAPANSPTASATAEPSSLQVTGDPAQGKFTLDEATKGLKPKGKLWADLDTDKGKLRCELYPDKAPIAVANFVGLARGLRPFKDPKTSEWVKRPAYDGTGFHRIVKGFMMQGGDPVGTGAGEPGYVFADEVWPGATHDRRGLLCMANRGPNTNGMQFFILDAAAKHLDSSYTIFGQCSPNSVIETLASAEVRGERAVNPPKIKKVTIVRK